MIAIDKVPEWLPYTPEEISQCVGITDEMTVVCCPRCLEERLVTLANVKRQVGKGIFTALCRICMSTVRHRSLEKGITRTDSRGYVYRLRSSIPSEHKHLIKNEFPTMPIAEHRYEMAKKLGRSLKKGENIHHIDGNRSNNSPDNLELWVVGQPAGQRIEDKIVWAVALLKEYAPQLLKENT